MPNEENCLHVLERVPDHAPVIELNGRGFLKPVFKCSRCKKHFYEIVKSVD